MCAHVRREIVHRKVRGIFIPHCNSLSSLVYEWREGSLVEGLPILRVKGIPLSSRVISSRVLSCSCSSFVKLWRRNYGDQVLLGFLLLLLLPLHHCVGVVSPRLCTVCSGRELVGPKWVCCCVISCARPRSARRARGLLDDLATVVTNLSSLARSQTCNTLL